VKYNSDDDGNVYSYKKGEIDKDGIRQVWIQIVYSDKGREKEIQSKIENGESTEGYDKLLKTETLVEVECKKQRRRILFIIDTDKDRKKLFSEDNNKPEWSYIIPDSLGEELFLKTVCK